MAQPHTARALSLLLLGSAAVIAASGVVHQMFWLGRGDLPADFLCADPV